jgi:hypothetical protein
MGNPDGDRVIIMGIMALTIKAAATAVGEA